ncbi:MAG TPA: dephospho-CoA kinase [Bauldia sp.]|nr:dephospho-CoA kinase [Bauldia sp.]
MLILGLTGSAAMGKSTVSAMFADRGVAVFDADRTVHALYRGAAAPVVEAAFPGTTVDGAVDRDRLRARVLGDERAMVMLEGLIHPLVKVEEVRFLTESRSAGRRVALLDIPLLFETKAEGEVNAVIVVSAPEAIQRERMMKRPGMTPERLEAMLARQVPDGEKRRRAHFVIDTGGALDETRTQVEEILRATSGMAGAF